jgi:hypothetical protein
MGRTYSFKDLTGSFTHPLVGDFPFAGQIGMGQATVDMATDRTTHDLAADGTVMPSYIAGDNGSISIEVQQTSDLNSFFLQWLNACKTEADAGNPTNWAAGALTLRNTVDGSGHDCNGISPQKFPARTYAAGGGKFTWVLMAADIQNH